MSADNGIFIAKFPDGFRVAYASASGIENINYFPEGSKERKDELRNYFGDSKVFLTYQEACTEARRIEEADYMDEGFSMLEYGICGIGEYESFN
jgi:hypothetical protein